MYYMIALVCCIIKLLNSNDLFQGKKGESGLNVLTVSSSLSFVVMKGLFIYPEALGVQRVLECCRSNGS